MLSFDAFVSEAFIDPKTLSGGINKIVSYLGSKGHPLTRFGGSNYFINFVKRLASGGSIRSSQMLFVSPNPAGPCISFNVETNRNTSAVASVNFYKSYDGKLSNPEFEIVSKGQNLNNLAKAVLAGLSLMSGPGFAPMQVTEVRRDDKGRIADPERRAQHEKSLKDRFEELVDEMGLYDISVNDVLGQNAINVTDEIPDDLPEEDASVQYVDLKNAIRSLASDEHKCIFVCGTAGVGKTYNVTKELKELGTPYHKVSGNITSASSAFEILYDNRHEGTVLLVDDCDSMFNPSNVNLLKAALGVVGDDGDPDNYRVSYVSGSTLDVSRWPLDKVEFYTELYDAQKAADEVTFNRLCGELGIVSGDGDDTVAESYEEDEDDMIEDGPAHKGAGYFPKEVMKALEKNRPLQRPSTFQFMAKGIFITNIPPENFRRDPHLKALLDRGELVPVVLKGSTVFAMLEKLLPTLKHLKVQLTMEEKQSLLQVVKEWYQKNRPNDFPSFRTFTLLFPHRKSGGDWQAYVERALRNKAGPKQ